MTELLHHKKMCTQCQKSPSILRPEHKLHIPYKKIFIVHLRGAIHLKKNKKHDSPAGLRGSISKTKVSRDLGPKPPIPLAFGSPSHATAAQCAEEGGSAG